MDWLFSGITLVLLVVSIGFIVLCDRLMNIKDKGAQ